MFQITTHQATPTKSGSEQHRGRAAIRRVTLQPFGNKTANEAGVERAGSCGIEADRDKRQDVHPAPHRRPRLMLHILVISWGCFLFVILYDLIYYLSLSIDR